MTKKLVCDKYNKLGKMNKNLSEKIAWHSLLHFIQVYVVPNFQGLKFRQKSCKFRVFKY